MQLRIYDALFAADRNKIVSNCKKNRLYEDAHLMKSRKRRSIERPRKRFHAAPIP